VAAGVEERDWGRRRRMEERDWGSRLGFPPWPALSLAVREASGRRQVDVQVAYHAACKWEGLRPMTTGPSEHMAHSSLTKKQKRLVQKKAL
jgi:hypothetical protein